MSEKFNWITARDTTSSQLIRGLEQSLVSVVLIARMGHLAAFAKPVKGCCHRTTCSKTERKVYSDQQFKYNIISNLDCC